MRKYIPEILAALIGIGVLIAFYFVFGVEEMKESRVGIVAFCTIPTLMVVFFRKDNGRDSDE